jgi:hypothetical protein
MRQSITRFISGLVLITAVGAGSGLSAALLAPGVAGATTVFTVNDAADYPLVGGVGGGTTTCTSTNVVDDVNTCTLRAAIQASQNLGESTTIVLPDPSTVEYDEASAYSVESTNGQLDINDHGNTVTIDGAGQSTAVIQAQCTGSCTGGVTSRVIKVESGTTADISGVTVEDGDPAGGNGGGILECGTMTLTDSTVTDNTALYSGGGIELSSSAVATLTGDTISDNTQTDSDGGSGGGGIYLETESEITEGLTITNSTITGNTTSENTDGAGLEINGNEGSGNLSDVVAITSSTFSDNLLGNDGYGGGIGQDELSTLSVSSSTISGNGPQDGAFAYGAGVYLDWEGSPDTFTDDSITGNQAYAGGGVWIDGGTATFSGTSISGNTVTDGAGGLYTDANDGEPLTITSSTISGNVVLGTVGDVLLGDGGGIVSQGCNGITLANDTIASNTATNGGGGYMGLDCGPEIPAVLHSQRVAHADRTEPTTATTAFLFDTVTGNAAGSGGGGNIQLFDDDSTVSLAETIVAGGIVGSSPTTNCAVDTDGYTGSITSAGYNLIDDSTCGTAASTDIIGQNPQLGSLGNNGGPTQTELPANSSPAVGAIPDATWVATGVGSDQRGVARGAGAASSATIGAVEVGQNFNGYRLVADEGGIFDFGLLFNGSLANNHLNAPIIGIANSPGPAGYLMVGSDGGVFALGGANFYGSLGGQSIPSPIAAIAATSSENGYWLAAQNGKIYPFGSVPALPAVQLPAGGKIVGMASDTTGKGAWLVDQYGNVFAEGDAQYEGGVSGHLNSPVVGIAAAASGQGYILVASDGGVFNYNTGFFGSVPGSLKPGQQLVAPIVGIAVTHSGNGYWEVGADGGVFTYGDAPFLGSIYTAIPGQKLNGPIVGIQHLGAAPAG